MKIGRLAIAEERRGKDKIPQYFVQFEGRKEKFGLESFRSTGWGSLNAATVVNELDVAFEQQENKILDVRRYVVQTEAVRTLVDRHGCDHPGLVLDKFGYRWHDQATVKGALQKVVTTRPADADVFLQRLARWNSMLQATLATQFAARTAGPFTLHLARAAALENAGLCLHPLYGFVYLPGSGLKGLARAYAETIWRKGRDDTAAKRDIHEVFGNEPGESNPHEQRAGNIVFHDAWPDAWPELTLDLVNNHHRDYYNASDSSKDSYPPGDWEEPTMVSFLAVKSGTRFLFALGKRRSDVDDATLRLAQEFLIGGLTQLGAGAKTAAGYGRFELVDASAPVSDAATAVASSWSRVLATKELGEFKEDLKLVTPAFLAGPYQDGSDCDLRAATLRGLLRWWWRTLHTGYLDVATLRSLEAAVWGDTKQGSPITLQLCPKKAVQPQLFDRKAILHDLYPNHRGGSFTNMGLTYHSYGMDEEDKERRHFIEPGMSWHLTVRARGTKIFGRQIDAGTLLDQARSALWLLCHLGGVGSKSRKGFGSMADLSTWTWEQCLAAAANVRASLPGRTNDRLPPSPSLSELISPSPGAHPWLSVTTPNTWQGDAWCLLDLIGECVKTIAKEIKPKEDRFVLGRPRQMTGVRDDSNVKRQASPVIFHIANRGSGFEIRTAIFPATKKPTPEDSVAVLSSVANQLMETLSEGLRARDGARVRRVETSRFSKPTTTATSQKVRVKILAPHKPRGFKVREEGRDRDGFLMYGKEPEDLPTLDETIEVYRNSVDPNAVQYRWDPPSPPPASTKGFKKGPRGHR